MSTILRSPAPRSLALALLPIALGAGASALAAPPSPPGAVSGTVDGTRVRLSWVAASDDEGVMGYNVYRDDEYLDTVGATTYVTEIDGEASSFYVVAFDAADDDGERGYSTRSPEARFASAPDAGQTTPRTDETPSPADETPPPADETAVTVREGEPPGPPLSPAAERRSPTSARLSWRPPAGGAAGYNVYRDDRYLGTVRATSLVDVGLEPDRDYAYYVTSFDAVPRFSPRSAVATARAVPTGAPAPATPTVPPAGPVTPTPTPDPTPDPAPSTSPTPSRPASPPTLDEPFADAVPSPAFDDPFGFTLELDPEPAVPGGPPTRPKNLRLDYVGNAFAEMSWAPSNDDEGVAAYRVDRSDGQSYTLAARLPATLPLDAGTFAEYEKYWTTTSFIDCNRTRFGFAPGSAKALAAPWNCTEVGPVPGDDFVYTVTAIDADGQASPASEPLSIAYSETVNAPVPYYDDFYLRAGDRFASETDLSRVGYFLDGFDLVWEDEFDGDGVDPEKWQTEVVFGDQRIINGEQQYFVDVQKEPGFGHDPFDFDADAGAGDGEAIGLRAIPFPEALRERLNPAAATACEAEDPTGLERCLFLSGALSSHDRFQFLYGYVEGRIRASRAPGALTSFYLYHRYPGGENDPRLRHGPEIDILEYLGENPFGDEDAFQTYHFVDPNTGLVRSSPTMNAPRPGGGTWGGEYHTFGVLWEPQLVIWYIDGREVKRIRGPQIARQPMNVVSYLVAGSGWAPTPDVSDPSIFPIASEVDYVRVYQRRGSASNFQVGR